MKHLVLEIGKFLAKQNFSYREGTNICNKTRPPWRAFVLVLYVLPIVGVLLAGTDIWHPYSYWLDELYSITTSSLEFSQMFKAMLTDVHPPLYQILLWLWIRVLSDHEPIVRGFSFACALSAFFYMYCWGRRLDPWTRAFTLFFFATSWLFIYYAQEARSYALLLFLSTLLIGLFAHDDGGEKYFWRILYVAILVASTHYFGLILTSSVLVWLTLQNIKSPTRLLWICAVSVAVHIWPLIQYFEGALGGKTGGQFWIWVDGPLGTLTVFFQALAPVFRTWGAKVNVILILLSTGLILLLLAYRLRRARISQNTFEKSLIIKMLFCLAWTLSAIAIIDLHTPISTDRNYIVLLPIVSILFGLGFGAVAKLRYAPIVTLVVALGWGHMQLNYSIRLMLEKWSPLQNWKACAQNLVQHADGHQLYYLQLNKSEEVDRVFNYYVKRFSSGALTVDPLYTPMLKNISSPAMIIVGGVAPDTIRQILHAENISPMSAFYPAQSLQKSTATLTLGTSRQD